MRKPVDVLSAEEVSALRHEAEARLEEKRAVSKARKEHMLKVRLPISAAHVSLHTRLAVE
jgi:hypothetical protein